MIFNLCLRAIQLCYMKYTVLEINTAFAEPFMQDVLVAELAELGFESFETEQQPLHAYIQTSLLNESAVKDALRDFRFDGIKSYKFAPCEDKDWNAEWESHFFEPIVVGNECVIHSSFAKDIPSCRYDITIDPKMAFGTGHHQTTSLMLEAILASELHARSVLDMGCGTAVLAILASMCGAEKLTAIDIDDWCVDNATENLRVNGISNIEVLLGDARLLAGRYFDLILANINRNILLADMAQYEQSLNRGGRLIISGFYTEDAPLLIEKAESLGLSFSDQKAKDNWCRLTFIK